MFFSWKGSCSYKKTSISWTGARIDHAHHDNIAKRALTETIAMDKAVKVAAEMTKEEDTLIIVTADHSHVFNIAGYPKRGNDILGNKKI